MSNQYEKFGSLADEKIIQKPENHWCWFASSLFKSSLAFLFLGGLIYVLPNFFLVIQIGRLFIILSCLLVAGYLIFKYKQHHWDQFIITNCRLVSVKRHGIFHNEKIEIPFDHIENVRAETHGFWGMIFNYGTLFISTAGGESMMEIGHYLAKPTEVQSLILKVRDDFLQRINKFYGKSFYEEESSKKGISAHFVAEFIKAISAKQSLVSEIAPIVGFSSSGIEKKIRQKNESNFNAEDESLLVDILTKKADLKKHLMKAITNDLVGDGRPPGYRLVKIVTSNMHFKKQVLDEMKCDLLS